MGAILGTLVSRSDATPESDDLDEDAGAANNLFAPEPALTDSGFGDLFSNTPGKVARAPMPVGGPSPWDTLASQERNEVPATSTHDDLFDFFSDDKQVGAATSTDDDVFADLFADDKTTVPR